MTLRLYYSHDPNPRVAVAVARYLAVPVLFVEVSPRELCDGRGADELIEPPGAAAACTPVPMLVEESRTLWETDAIACRLSMLAGADLWPTDELAPELQTWLSWARGFLRAAGAFHRAWVTSEEPAREPVVSGGAVSAFHRFASVLDEVLSRRFWLIDNRLTYADFRVATALPFAVPARLPVSGYPHLLDWHARLCRLSAWACPWPDATGAAAAMEGSPGGRRPFRGTSGRVPDIPAWRITNSRAPAGDAQSEGGRSRRLPSVMSPDGF